MSKYEIAEEDGWFYPKQNHPALGKPDMHFHRWNRAKGQHVVIRYKTEQAAKNYIARHSQKIDRRAEYKAMWNNAANNSACKRRRHRIVEWKVAEGQVSLPDFIKGQAKQKMQMLDGKVLLKDVRIVYTYHGHIRLLALLLGYKKANGHPNVRYVNECMWRGMKPKKVEQHAMLQMIASKAGRTYVVRRLKAMGLYEKYYGFGDKSFAECNLPMTER